MSTSRKITAQQAEEARARRERNGQTINPVAPRNEVSTWIKTKQAQAAKRNPYAELQALFRKTE